MKKPCYNRFYEKHKYRRITKTPLSAADVAEADAIVSDIKHREDDTLRLAELAVKWVGQNPTPIPLEKPAYKR